MPLYTIFTNIKYFETKKSGKNIINHFDTFQNITLLFLKFIYSPLFSDENRSQHQFILL